MRRNWCTFSATTLNGYPFCTPLILQARKLWVNSFMMKAFERHFKVCKLLSSGTCFGTLDRSWLNEKCFAYLVYQTTTLIKLSMIRLCFTSAWIQPHVSPSADCFHVRRLYRPFSQYSNCRATVYLNKQQHLLCWARFKRTFQEGTQTLQDSWATLLQVAGLESRLCCSYRWGALFHTTRRLHWWFFNM